MKFVYLKALFICFLICTLQVNSRKHKSHKRNKRLFFGLFDSGPDAATIDKDVNLIEMKDNSKLNETLMFLYGFFSTVGITYSSDVASALKLAYDGKFVEKKVDVGNKQFNCFADIFKVIEDLTSKTEEKSDDDVKICNEKKENIGKYIFKVYRYKQYAGFYCNDKKLEDYKIKEKDMKDIIKSLQDKYPDKKNFEFQFFSKTKEEHCNFEKILQKFIEDLAEDVKKIDCSKVTFDKSTGLLSKIAQKINNPINVVIFCFKCAVEKLKSDLENKIKDIIGTVAINALDFLLGRGITLIKLIIITVKVFMILYSYFYESDQFKRLEYLGNISGYAVRAALEILSFPLLESIWHKKALKFRKLRMKLNKK